MSRQLLFIAFLLAATLGAVPERSSGQGTDLYNRRIFLNRVFFQGTGELAGRGEIYYTVVGKAATCLGCTEARTFPEDFTTNPMKVRKARKDCADATCSEANPDCRWHYMDQRSTVVYPPRMIYGDKDLALPGSDVTLTLGFTEVDRPIRPFIDAIGLSVSYIWDCVIQKGSGSQQTCTQLQNSVNAAWNLCRNTPYTVNPTVIGEYTGIVPFLTSEGYDCLDPFTFTNTLKNALARGELWIDQTVVGKGEEWDRPISRDGQQRPTELVETIEHFRIGQISGNEIRLWAQVGEPGLRDPSWLGDHVREWIFPMMVVGGAGNPAPPYCGATHYASIRQILVGSAIQTTTKLYRWEMSPSPHWEDISQNPSNAPYDVYLGNYGVALTVSFTAIGHSWVNPICAWVHLLKDGNILSSAPDAPCTGPGLCIATEADDDCPEVLDVRFQADANGITNRVDVEFTEPVIVPAGSVTLSPSVAIATSLDPTQRILSIQPSQALVFPPGQFQITLNGNLITDKTEWQNKLKAAFNAACGTSPIVPFCVKDGQFFASGANGVQRDHFEPADHIYISGTGFPNGTYHASLVPDDLLEYEGEWTLPADQTNDGPNLVTVSGGAFSLVDIGVALNNGEYVVVLDVSDDGVLNAGDRFISPCEMGVTVGEPCPDLSAEDDIAYFTLDEVSNAFDYFADLAGGAPGNGSGGVVTAPGVIHSGRTFSGSAYIRVADHSDLDVGTSDFTLSYWVKSTAATGRRGAIDKRTNGSAQGYSSFLSNGKAAIELRTSSTSTTWNSVRTVTDGSWHHVCIAVERNSATGLKMYIDGQLDLTGDPRPRNASLSNSVDFLIGGDHGGSHMIGTMDEVRLIDGAIPQSHVSLIYMAGLEGQRCQSIPAGVDDPTDGDVETVADASGVIAHPNPMPRGRTMFFSVAPGSTEELTILDVAGRRVRTLRSLDSGPGNRLFSWDGLDANGNELPAGVYFCRGASSRNGSNAKVVILE